MDSSYENKEMVRGKLAQTVFGSLLVIGVVSVRGSMKDKKFMAVVYTGLLRLTWCHFSLKKKKKKKL